MEIEVVDPFHILFNAGDVGHKFYCILEGEVKVYGVKDDAEIDEIIRSPRNCGNNNAELSFLKKVIGGFQLYGKGIPFLTLRKILSNGETFGEIALSVNQHRTATVIASKKTTLLTLDKAKFKEMCAYTAGFTSFLLDILKKTFPNMSSKHLAHLLCQVKEISLPRNTKLTEQGKIPNSCYIIKRGAVKVSQTSNRLVSKVHVDSY